MIACSTAPNILWLKAMTPGPKDGADKRSLMTNSAISDIIFRSSSLNKFITQSGSMYIASQSTLAEGCKNIGLGHPSIP
jgi:hypothetical protein